MVLAHIASVRNALADTVVDLFDLGTPGDANGDVEVGTTNFASSLCIIDLPAPPSFTAAGTPGVGQAEIPSGDLPIEGTAIAAGTAADFRVRDRANAEVVRGDIGLTGSGEDMEISSTTIAIGDVIRITAFTYTASA